MYHNISQKIAWMNLPFCGPCHSTPNPSNKTRADSGGVTGIFPLKFAKRFFFAHILAIFARRPFVLVKNIGKRESNDQQSQFIPQIHAGNLHIYCAKPLEKSADEPKLANSLTNFPR